MLRFETVLILTPVLSEEQAAAATAKFRKILKDLGCKILHEEKWGLKEEPALLHKEHWEGLEEKSTGYYRLFEYDTANGNVVKDFELALKRDERVLRFMSARLDKTGG